MEKWLDAVASPLILLTGPSGEKDKSRTRFDALIASAQNPATVLSA
jgi:hypothetical protein